MSNLTRLSPSTVDIGISTDTLVPSSLRLFISSSLSPSFVPRSLHSFVPFQVSGCVLWGGAKCVLMTGSTSRSQTTGPVVCTGITATKTTRRVLRGQQRMTTATCLVSTRGRYFRKMVSYYVNFFIVWKRAVIQPTLVLFPSNKYLHLSLYYRLAVTLTFSPTKLFNVIETL